MKNIHINFKKILVCGASLLMLASSGAGVASADTKSQSDAKTVTALDLIGGNDSKSGYEEQPKLGPDSAVDLALSDVPVLHGHVKDTKTLNKIILQFGKKLVKADIKLEYGKKTANSIMNQPAVRHFKPTKRAHERLMHDKSWIYGEDQDPYYHPATNHRHAHKHVSHRKSVRHYRKRYVRHVIRHKHEKRAPKRVHKNYRMILRTRENQLKRAKSHHWNKWAKHLQSAIRYDKKMVAKATPKKIGRKHAVRRHVARRHYIRRHHYVRRVTKKHVISHFNHRHANRRARHTAKRSADKNPNQDFEDWYDKQEAKEDASDDSEDGDTNMNNDDGSGVIEVKGDSKKAEDEALKRADEIANAKADYQYSKENQEDRATDAQNDQKEYDRIISNMPEEIAEFKTALFNDINHDREQNGLPALAYDNEAQGIADLRAQQTASVYTAPNGQYASDQQVHGIDSNGYGEQDRLMQKDGIPTPGNDSARENSAIVEDSDPADDQPGAKTANETEDQYMNHDEDEGNGHRANILANDVSRVAIGVNYGVNKNDPSDGPMYYVNSIQDFR